MKRSLADTPARSTAGCLPVPLFNQKKRTRQPLTSNPLKNEPDTGSGSRSYDFSPSSFVDFNQHSSPVLQEETFVRRLVVQKGTSVLQIGLGKNGWGAVNPEVDELQKAANSGQAEHPMAPSLMKPPNASKFNLANAGKNVSACRNRNEYTPLGKTANSRSDNGTSQKFPSSLKSVQQQNHPDCRNPSQLIKTDAFKGKWPVKPNTVARSLKDQSPAYKFNCNTQQNKMNENQFGCVPEDKSQEMSSSQVKTKIKKNSLRILSAVIQSVRHWSQYAYKTALLFEVLGTLDSAVTPGAYGAKNFLLRDGKETLPCVFYEIDRELPRLIRGRVHRCMGTYDAKKNIFKCVSVRPATAQEQDTFQDFVKIADVEMTAYVKTMNEM